MTDAFKVGEVCIGQNFVNSPEYNGVECIVLRGIETELVRERTSGQLSVESVCVVEFVDGLITRVWPHNLRRKQPPTGEKSILRMFTAPAPREVEAA